MVLEISTCMSIRSEEPPPHYQPPPCLIQNLQGYLFTFSCQSHCMWPWAPPGNNRRPPTLSYPTTRPCLHIAENLTDWSCNHFKPVTLGVLNTGRGQLNGLQFTAWKTLHLKSIKFTIGYPFSFLVRHVSCLCFALNWTFFLIWLKQNRKLFIQTK